MNRQPKITRREQQDFLKDENIRFLHFAVRVCPCDGVGCSTCNNTMKYFGDPVPMRGAITSGMNSKKKEAQFPTVNKGSYKLLVEPRHRFVKGDRIIPFGMREFEDIDEKLPVSDPQLTFIPINPRGVAISFIGVDGVIDFRPIYDFTIRRKLYGRVPLYSKEINWEIDTPEDQEFFSARYGYYPEFEIDEIPAANLSQGQLLIQQLDLKKITINDVKKQKSNENSSKAVIGVQYV